MVSRAPSPPPKPQPPKHIECFSCFRKGPPDQVVQCKRCGMSLHAGACGVDIDVLREGKPEDWLCELCDNEKTMEFSLNSDCIVCPPHQNTSSKALSYLRACKPTEGQGWIHVLCSVFIPECQFSDALQLRIVEGISTIPRSRWASVSWRRFVNIPC